MKKIILLAMTGLFSPVLVHAVDTENGKTLYETHCIRCHGSEVFQRADRLVNTEKQLIERIKQCELSNELAWFEEEVNDVARYLAEQFYQFDLK